MNILVTGGLGYIGSHTVIKLIQQGFNPIIVDNLSNSNIEMLQNIETITGVLPVYVNIDLSRESQLKLIDLTDLDAVIHFAALKSVGESTTKSTEYYKNNIGSLLNILGTKPKKIIFSSSCTVYGNDVNSPVKETSMFGESTSPYGETKIICENILKNYVKFSDSSVISLRYFNPVGSHVSGIIGDNPKKEAMNLFPVILRCYKNNEKLKIFGKDYDTKDGTCIRDYIHVEDLAESHLVALKRLFGIDKKYESFNIGTGQGYTVLDIVEEFGRNGMNIEYEFVDRRNGDIEKIYSDIEFSKNVLGFECTKNLSDMVKDSINFYNNFK